MSKQTMRYLIGVPLVMPFAVLAYGVWSLGMALTAVGEWGKEHCERFSEFLFKIAGCYE